LLRYIQYGERDRAAEKNDRRESQDGGTLPRVGDRTRAAGRTPATLGRAAPIAERDDEYDTATNPDAQPPAGPGAGTCNYIRQKRNVLICGPTGVGRILLAQALVLEACRRDLDALFINTCRMLQHINGGRADGTQERRVQTYLRPDLKGQDKTPHFCQVVSSEAQWSD
jgi:hypothetical protein